MNLLPLLLGFLLLGKVNKQDKKQAFDLSQILSNPDVANLLPHVAKLLDKNAGDDDKNFAIMNLLTNPAIFEIVQKFATRQTPNQQQEEKTQTEKQAENIHKTEQNKEENIEQTNLNNTQKTQTFSAESQEFFAPIQEVADKQISKKLYALYDNWYVKK